MRSLLRAPLLSAGLVVLWILLEQSIDPATVALGLVLAVFWPAVTAKLGPARVRRARKPLTLLRLFARVVLAMLQSNAAVARIILSRARNDVPAGFVHVPLELRDPTGLAVLAMIITFTPGTAWVQLSADGGTLVLHAIGYEDETALIEVIKRRYERPLMEVFQ
jgi:multicomponent K+:H+ antiporter subunit E